MTLSDLPMNKTLIFIIVVAGPYFMRTAQKT